jgi:hypothetical protein
MRVLRHAYRAASDGSLPGRTGSDQITFHANNNSTAATDLAIAQSR